MKNRDRAVVEEVAGTTKELARSVDLLAVIDDKERRRDRVINILGGLDTNVGKLAGILKEDACDGAKAKKLVGMLKGYIKATRKAIRARTKVAYAMARNCDGDKFNVVGELVSDKHRLYNLEGALMVATSAIADKANPLVALRFWAASNLEALRIIITDNRPIHSVLKEIEEQNGIKAAIIGVNDILNYKINV